MAIKFVQVEIVLLETVLVGDPLYLLWKYSSYWISSSNAKLTKLDKLDKTCESMKSYFPAFSWITWNWITVQAPIILQTTLYTTMIFSDLVFLIFEISIWEFKEYHLDKIKEFLQMYTFCLLSSYKKGGKIQTGLNWEYDSLAVVVLNLSHSNFPSSWFAIVILLKWIELVTLPIMVGFIYTILYSLSSTSSILRSFK